LVLPVLIYHNAQNASYLNKLYCRKAQHTMHFVFNKAVLSTKLIQLTLKNIILPIFLHVSSLKLLMNID
jgi:hypothetical protein